MTPYGRRVAACLVAGAGVGLVAALLTTTGDEGTITTSSGSAPPSASAAEAPPPPSTGATTITGGRVSAAPPLDATTTTLATTTTAPATTVDPNAPRSVSMLFTGDIVVENPVLDAGRRGAETTGGRFDFGPLFAPIAPLVQAYDLAVCQMELPIGRPDEEPGAKGRSPHGGNRLLAPYEMARGLRDVGFDRCTTASNHSYDVGDAGIDSTIDALEEAGISWSGTARRPEELPPPIITVHGVRIAHLSYTRYSNTDPPADEWRLAYTANPDRVAREVDEARAAGAELVVVSIHLSKELQFEPLPETRAFVDAVLAATPVDAIVHHGPHVVQGYEEVAGTPVWWTIGNLVSGMARPNAADRYTDPRTRDGLGAALTFTETGVGTGDFTVVATSVVLCNEAAARTVRRGTEAMDDAALPADIRDEMRGCVERTRQAVPGAT